MALFRKRKMLRETALKKEYLKYYNKMKSMKETPMTYANWLTKGREKGYFKFMHRTSPEAYLSESDRKELARFRRK